MKRPNKNWIIYPKAPESFLNKKKEFSPLFAQILYNRGLKNEKDIELFLRPDYERDLHSPFLFNDMEKAVNRILKAIEKDEKILIWGDYDVDGITATIILWETLKILGAQQLEYYIPKKEKEGYGLSLPVLKEKIKKGISLIITCDCGISAEKEIQWAQKMKVDVIITDHHNPPQKLPPAYALLNPKVKNCGYPFQELAGSGVAFKLSEGLIYKKLGKNNHKGINFLKWLLDLVALGTLADVVPLVGENRVLTKYGFLVLSKTKRPGLDLLFKIASVDKENLTSSDIVFRVVPRLNAAGRLAHADIALKLLLESDPSLAVIYAFELEKLNEKRQRLENKILKEARSKIKIEKDQKIIIVEGERWPVGVLGIIAGRLKDEFGLPVIVFNKENGVHVGSARSIEEFDITEALSNLGQILINFGGHKKAAGLSLPEELFESFYENFHKIAKEKLSEKEILPTLHIDSECSFSDISSLFIKEIRQLEPFGLLNPRPIFLTKNVIIKDKKTFGSRKQHLKFLLKNGNIVKEALAFGWGFLDDFQDGEVVSIVWSFEDAGRLDNFEIKILDIKKEN